MEHNKSLSARIKRRNNKGFAGLGNKFIATRDGELVSYTSLKANKMGDYSDTKQNHKDVDYRDANKLKNKVGFKLRSWNHKHLMSKKFADNHQKL